MNIFEDLIEELKEENLLEQTVVETSKLEGSNQNLSLYQSNQSFQSAETFELPQPNLSFEKSDSVSDLPPMESMDLREPESLVNPPEVTEKDEEANLKQIFAELEMLEKNSSAASTENSANSLVTELTADVDIAEANFNSINDFPIEDIRESQDFENMEDPAFPSALTVTQPITDEKEFFRRRATEEVNSLEIVEHIFGAIEREQMKILPTKFDDIAVKMALHDFLKSTTDEEPNDQAQFEFKLMQETENWYSALSNRDKHVSIGDLRRYCENTRPPLSPQALGSLARFYRNSPFSETVRNKFDVIVTRLLTKECFPDRRELLFDHKDLITHLHSLYADWASIPLYEVENDSDVSKSILCLEEFIAEANGAETFEDLIKSDFFNRLRSYKEGIGEKFFSPVLTATSIKCNVIVGNKYVELLEKERFLNNSKSLEDKYQFFLDQTVSDATSKTLKLVEVLKEKELNLSASANAIAAQKLASEESLAQRETLKLDTKSGFGKKYTPDKPGKKNSFFKINKWLLAAAILTVLFAGGLVAYVEVFTDPIKTSASVVKVDLEGSALKDYFKTARINRGTFFAVTQPSWEGLTKDVKEDILKKTLSLGNEKGYSKIHLLNSEGKTIGYASAQKIDLDIK